MRYYNLLIGIVFVMLISACFGKITWNYLQGGDDWADVVPNAQLCRSGQAQSPIYLSTKNYTFAEKMVIDGYGYERFEIDNTDIMMPMYGIPFSGGELITTDHEGKKTVFEPFLMSLHETGCHAVDGDHHELEVHIYHHFKGTDK